MNKELGQKKASLSATKTNREKNKAEIAEYDKGIETIRKYRQRIGIFRGRNKKVKSGKGYLNTKKEECL